MPASRNLFCALLVAGIARLASGQSLHGSPSSVDKMYTRAVSNDLNFFRTPDGIYEAALDGEFVMIGITEDMTLEDVAYPFVLPKTKEFLYSFAKRYHDACGERLIVTSAARPTTEQPRNASPKSVHPTGMAVDFRKPAGACLTFMRTELLKLEDQGLIEATEEKHPVHFHVALLRQQRSAVVTLSNGDVVSPPAGTSPQVAEAPASASPAAATKPAASKPSTYTVRRGDTLSGIAKKYGSTVAKLKSLNHLSRSTLHPGQKLRIG